MVGVGARATNQVPRVIPLHAFNVDEDPHQLRYGEGRMSIVQLNGDLENNVAHA